MRKQQQQQQSTPQVRRMHSDGQAASGAHGEGGPTSGGAAPQRLYSAPSSALARCGPESVVPMPTTPRAASPRPLPPRHTLATKSGSYQEAEERVRNFRDALLRRHTLQGTPSKFGIPNTLLRGRGLHDPHPGAGTPDASAAPSAMATPDLSSPFGLPPPSKGRRQGRAEDVALTLADDELSEKCRRLQQKLGTLRKDLTGATAL